MLRSNLSSIPRPYTTLSGFWPGRNLLFLFSYVFALFVFKKIFFAHLAFFSANLEPTFYLLIFKFSLHAAPHGDTEISVFGFAYTKSRALYFLLLSLEIVIQTRGSNRPCTFGTNYSYFTS